MTKKKETGVLASAKEETLNQIITAQKEKIEALTEYGKKLKKQLKYCKDQSENDCDDLIQGFQEELSETERLHQKVLIAAIGGGILLGIFIGTFI